MATNTKEIQSSRLGLLMILLFVRFKRTIQGNGDPTGQPSQQPSMQPSSQPSRQPTRYDSSLNISAPFLLSTLLYCASRVEGHSFLCDSFLPLCSPFLMLLHLIAFLSLSVPCCFLFSLSHILMFNVAQSTVVSA